MDRPAGVASRFAFLRRRDPVERRSARRRNRLAMVTAAVALAVVGLTQTPAYDLARLHVLDYATSLSPAAPGPDAPVIVAIDEPSLSAVGRQWPWPRGLHGDLVAALRKAGAKAIGLDIIFAEPSTPEEDGRLAAALGPDVVLAGDETLIQSPEADQLVRVEALPALQATGARSGIASIALDRDGVLRRLPGYDDGFARVLAASAGLDTPDAGALPQGAMLWPAGPARSFRTVSYYQALEPETYLPDGFFKGRTVIVGLSLQTAPTIEAGGAGSDAYATAFTVLSGRLLPGAEIQATIFDNLVGRRFVVPAPAPVGLAAVLAAALAGALIMRRATDWKTAALASAAVAIIAAGALAILYGARVFVDPLAPAAALAAVAMVQTGLDYAEERRNRREILRAFSQYLAPALVERLAADPSRLKLGGERRVLSILFCDVRGFTAIAEGMKDEPEALTTLMNRMLTPLSDVVLAHGGTIDKYIGDCIMAFWNAPLDDPDHAVHAVDAALGMLAAIEALNADLSRESIEQGATLPVLRIGIGINTGECVVGNMGSERRFDYSALGDAVNLAARLESASKDHGVSLVLGEATVAALAGRRPVREIARVTVKGRQAATVLYTIDPARGAWPA